MMSELLPWLRERATDFIGLEDIDKEDVPRRAGVYIMVSENTEYIYPWRKSRVFYIGQGADLRTRLWVHRRFYLEARDKPPYPYYWPKYEYAAAHGCEVAWIVCKDAQSGKRLEHNLLVDFASYCGAQPVANNQGAFNRIL